MASVNWDDYMNPGGTANARDYYDPTGGGGLAGFPPGFAPSLQPAATNDAGQTGTADRATLAAQNKTPSWIANDYWAPDWQTVFADPTRWGADPNAPKTTAAPQGDPEAFRAAWYASGGKTTTDLANFVKAHPEYGATITGSKGSKLQFANGQAFQAVRSAGINGGIGPAWDDLSAGGDQGGTYGNSGSTSLYQNEILSRLDALRQPINDPLNQLLQMFALQRVGDLNGAPYTAGDDAALVAHYRDPATQARDAAIQRRKEELSARGIGPTSGLYQQQIADVEKQYQQGIASASNDLAVKAVDQKQQNAQEQLAILASLMGNETAQRNETYQRGADLVSTAGLLPQLDETRLNDLLKASGSGDTSQGQSLQALMQILGLNQNQNQVNQANSQANASAWGQYLAYVLNNL